MIALLLLAMIVVLGALAYSGHVPDTRDPAFSLRLRPEPHRRAEHWMKRA